MNETHQNNIKNKGFLQRLRGSGSIWRLSIVCFLVVSLPGFFLFQLEEHFRFGGGWSLSTERPAFLMFFSGACFLGGFFVVLIGRGIDRLGAPPWLTGTVVCILAFAMMAFPLLLPIFYALFLCPLWCIVSTVAIAYGVIPTKKNTS
jgi:hypothetical protein